MNTYPEPSHVGITKSICSNEEELRDLEKVFEKANNGNRIYKKQKIKKHT